MESGESKGMSTKIKGTEESSSNAHERDSADSRNEKIQNTLRSPEKIITSCHGFLLLLRENLKKIIDSAVLDDHPVAFVAVIGPPQSGKSFMTNMILHLGSNLTDGGWLESLMKEGEFRKGFKFGGVTASENVFEPDLSDRSRYTSGIYLWPTPFLMEKANREKVYIWVLHYRIADGSSSTAEDVDGIENMLGLMCSRILEIMTGNQELRVARARRLFASHGNSLTSHANVCDSVVVLYSSEDTKNAPKVLTEDDAKTWLLDLERIPDVINNEESVLDEFKHLNLIRMQTISKPLHDNEGRFIQDAIKPLMKPLRLTVNTLLMEEDEISPKTNLKGDMIRVRNVIEYVENCVNCVNQLNSRMAEVENEVPLKKEKVTEQQYYDYEAEVKTSGSWLVSQNGDVHSGEKFGNEELNQDTDTSVFTSFLETSIDEADEEEKALKQLVDSVMSPSPCIQVKAEAPPQNESQSQILESSSESETSFSEEVTRTTPSMTIPAKSDESNEMDTQDIHSTSAEDASFEHGRKSDVENHVEPMEDDTALVEAVDAARHLEEKKRKNEEDKRLKMENEKRLREENAKRLWEEEERKLAMEREKKKADLELAEVRLKMAMTQVKQMVPTFSLYWINTDDFRPQNVSKYLDIYYHCLNETLNECHRNEVATYLWDDFCKGVHTNCFDDCNAYLSLAFEPVSRLNTELGRQLQLYGYFPLETFETMASQIATKCMTVQAMNDPEIYELMSTAMGNLIKIYKDTNAIIMDMEKAIRETAGLRVKNFYNEEMKRYLGDNGAFSKQEFHEIHCELARRLIESSKKIVNSSSGSIFPNDFQEWLSNLERDLNDAFAGHRESNELKLVTLQKQINKLVSARYDEYVAKIEDLLRKNPEGYDREKLQRDSIAYAEVQKNLLVIDLRNKIRKTEPTEGHCEALLHQINQYWPTVEKANDENIEKKRKLMEEERIRRLDQERAQRAQSRQKITKQVTTSDSKRETYPFPLIFRLSYSYVAMGTMIDGRFKLLENPNGDLSTPVAVGISNDGELVYGTEAMVYCSSSENYWWITEYLGGNNFESIRKKIQFRHGEYNFVYEASVEFLLGYLMRSLKDYAENQLNGCFQTVVVTIPHWFCSTHRIQVRDAATVAGFSQVHLVNEESALAYICASSQRRVNSEGSLLVLSENFGVISTILYSYTEGNPRKVLMIAENFAICQGQAVKKGGVKKWMKDKLRSFRDVLTGDSPEAEAKVNLVRKLCAKMFEKRRFSDRVFWPDDVMLLTDSDDVEHAQKEWLDAFTDVVRDRSYGRVAYLEFANQGCGFVAMLGASVICQNSLDKISTHVRDALVHEVYRLSFKNGAAYCLKKAIAKEVPFLPEKSKLYFQELQKSVKDAKFFQQNPFDGKDEVPIGRVEVGPSVSNTLQIYPILEINSEGIVTLNGVKCDPSKNQKYGQKEVTNDFNWTTPNLSEIQRDDMKGFMEILMQHKHATQYENDGWEHVEVAVEAETESEENRVVIEAKSSLTKVCEDIDQGMREDRYNFKTDVSKELLKKKVEKARNLVQKSDASLGDIEKETEALLKAHNKYFKS